MYNKTRTPASWIKTICLCGAASMLLSVLLCMLASALILKGVLPQGAINSLAIGICFISVLAGSLVCAKAIGEKCLPTALAAAAVYILLALMLKGLFFRGGFGQTVFLLPAAAVAAILAGLLGAKRKKRRK